MKKKFIIMSMLFAIISIAVFGCAKMKGSSSEKENAEHSKKQEESMGYQFDAQILEIEKEYLLVEALDGQVVTGEVKVWTGLLEKDHIPALEVGDTVRITNDGKMTMSIPAQMTAVEITKISK